MCMYFEKRYLFKENNCDKNPENVWGRNNDKSFKKFH